MFACCLNGSLKNRSFNDPTHVHDLNTGLVQYSDPYFKEVYLTCMSVVKNYYIVVKFEQRFKLKFVLQNANAFIKVGKGNLSN